MILNINNDLKTAHEFYRMYKYRNQITNIEFICSKVENVIDNFQKIDLIIVDPPRTGLDQKTKKYLEKINAQTIIYVSCDAITQARDIKDLEHTYSVEYVKPFNMFPRTYHVETVVLMSRGDAK